jgi:ubiquitin-activating enzyme E1
VPLVPFKPKAGVKIETDEKKKDEPVVINDEDEEEAAKLLTILEGYELNPALKTNVVEFEKDDPTNFHIEFMGGVSNLRVYIVLDRLATTSSMRSTTSRSS